MADAVAYLELFQERQGGRQLDKEITGHVKGLQLLELSTHACGRQGQG